MVDFKGYKENVKKCTPENLYYQKLTKFAVYFLIKSKFYKKRGATFFYDITHKLGPLGFTQYGSKLSSF